MLILYIGTLKKQNHKLFDIKRQAFKAFIPKITDQDVKHTEAFNEVRHADRKPSRSILTRELTFQLYETVKLLEFPPY